MLAGVEALGRTDTVPGRERPPPLRFVTGVVDVAARRLLDVVQKEDSETFVRVGRRPAPAVARRVKVAAMDPFRGLRHRPADLAAARDPGVGRLPCHPARVRRRR